MNKIAVKPAILEFPVVPDVGKIIEIVGKTPDSFLLDSADPAHHSRRYSYAGFAPQQIVSGYDNPWLALEEIYREIATPIDSTIPFCGGLVGFLTYESGQNPPRPPLTKGGVGRFEFPFGELLISLDTAKRQAEELGHPFFQEIKILLIHGILHLLGYKDKKKRDCVRMWKETEKLLGGVSLI